MGVREIARGGEGDGRAIHKIVTEILSKRVIDDDSDHARVQLARLETALQAAGEAVAGGDIKAIGPYLRVLDRFDRYRGAAAARSESEGVFRQKLLEKLDHAAEAYEEEKFEKRRAARLREALADSSIGEEDGYASEEAQFFLNFGISV